MAFSEKVKSDALSRAGNKCECKRKCSHHSDYRCGNSRNLQAHHIKALKDGGSDTLSNCEILCETCHQNTKSYGD